MPHKYSELTPAELTAAFAAQPVAYLPWGALEWHGAHLPLGLDGLVAEVFAERLATRCGGVLLPGFWLPVTALPHAASLSVRAELVAGVLDDLLTGLYGAGCRVACVISGHYAQGHELVLMEAAERAMAAHEDYAVLCGTPLALLGDPDLLDHAGQWETAQLLQIRPDLVQLEHLPTTRALDPAHDAVLGADPRTASAAAGADVLARAEAVWAALIARLVDMRATRASLADLYAARRADYQSYVETYYTGSWEEAAARWWQARTAA